MFRPTRSKKISQHFGENKACIYPGGKIVGKRGGACPPNSEDFYKSMGMEGHNGMDIPGIVGENVCHSATFDGIATTENDWDGGLGVDVYSSEPLFFEGMPPESVRRDVEMAQNGFLSYVKLRYWHLHGYIAKDEQEVKFGQPVGLLGNTGASSGAHLHWSWKFVDKDRNSLNLGGGWYGARNPESTKFGVTYDHSEFSYDMAKTLKIQVPLTETEKKEIRQKISIIQSLILQLRELLARL